MPEMTIAGVAMSIGGAALIGLLSLLLFFWALHAKRRSLKNSGNYAFFLMLFIIGAALVASVLNLMGVM